MLLLGCKLIGSRRIKLDLIVFSRRAITLGCAFLVHWIISKIRTRNVNPKVTARLTKTIKSFLIQLKPIHSESRMKTAKSAILNGQFTL